MPSAPLFGSAAGQALYNLVFKRTSTYTVFVLGGAFVGERVYDGMVEGWWKMHNKGKFWEDVKIVKAEE